MLLNLKGLLKFLLLVVFLLYLINFSILFIHDLRHRARPSSERTLFADKTIHFDPELGWDFSGTDEDVVYNDRGVRDPHSFNELKSMPQLVIAIGSSVVLSPEVKFENTFEQLATHQSQYYILNLGFEGFELYRERKKYERDLAELKPKKIIWFVLANDLVTQGQVLQKVKETLRIHQEINENRPWLNFENSTQLGALGKVAVFAANLRDSLSEGLNEGLSTQALRQKVPLKVYSDLTSELRDWNTALRSQGTELIVFFTPTRDFTKHLGWKDAIAFQQIAEFLDNEKIKWCENYSELKSNHFVTPAHWNELGQEVIAKSLVECLKK